MLKLLWISRRRRRRGKEGRRREEKQDEEGKGTGQFLVQSIQKSLKKTQVTHLVSGGAGDHQSMAVSYLTEERK